eukprot:CAMPEP_0171902712 /NCGR_PEP_ID=MMETSP0993-20121228/2105_1 /TAXON_ID=483369 /ORGANISM="non described non described, Strain CCMP2098" /LENGTH=309 /DNA_ID=CAMNT_0012532433 /DNA_START=45 /DNA_END=974 /DNA_ORIENTATION=-
MNRSAGGDGFGGTMKKEELEKEKLNPKWKDSMLDLFESRSSTLNQNVMVASLSSTSPQMSAILSYLTSRLDYQTGPAAIAALRRIWETMPTALRVKELFETVETFKIVEPQIRRILGRAAKRSRTSLATGVAEHPSSTNPTSSTDDIENIYDLAAGHGLLGVLIAQRFPTLANVKCVDLEQRPYFEGYVSAFRDCGSALANLSFVEADIADVQILPHSFVLIVHGCNEANVLALDLACASSAGFAAMPCCIRDGLYSVQSTKRIESGAQYAMNFGLMANAYNAHTVRGIDRRISDKNLMMLGGYERLAE